MSATDQEKDERSSGSIAASRGTVLASIFLTVLEAAEATGLSRAELLEKTAIPAASLADPEARIPQPSYMKLWEEIERHTTDPFFGLHFAQAQVEAATFSVVGFAARSSQTYREAVGRVARYSRLLNDTEEISLTADAGTWLIGQNPRGVALPWSRHKAEGAIANYVVLGRAWTGRTWSPIEVNFVHPRPRDTSEHHRLFGCTIHFERPRNEIRVDADILDLPLRSASRDLSDYLSQRADTLLNAVSSGTLLDDVRRAIRDTLPNGPPELSTIARRLGLSSRSLQRKLADSETTFARLVDQTRHDLSLNLLTDRRVSVEEVGFLLGFADSRGFRRAFERWTGCSPKAYRTSDAALAR